MSIHDNTKYAFANAIKHLLTTKDLNKVRVKEICDLCEVERPTFYYHFQDKYALVSWIYEQDLKKSTKMAGGYYNVIQLEHLLNIMRKENEFYKKAFSYVSQNALHKHILELNFKLFAEITKAHGKINNITKKQQFDMTFYIYAWIGCLRDWIFEKYDVSAKEYAEWMYYNIRHIELSNIKSEE